MMAESEAILRKYKEKKGAKIDGELYRGKPEKEF